MVGTLITGAFKARRLGLGIRDQVRVYTCLWKLTSVYLDVSGIQVPSAADLTMFSTSALYEGSPNNLSAISTHASSASASSLFGEHGMESILEA